MEMILDKDKTSKIKEKICMIWYLRIVYLF